MSANEYNFMKRMLARVKSIESTADRLIYAFPQEMEVIEAYKHLYEAVKLLRPFLLYCAKKELNDT